MTITLDDPIVVTGYNTEEHCHVCNVGEHRGIRIDLMVNGDFPPETKPEDLIGKTYECDYLAPYVSLAMNVRPMTN